MKCWIVIYEHRHGVDVWPQFQDRRPSVKRIIKSLDDWEGEEKGEMVNVRGPYSVPDRPAKLKSNTQRVMVVEGSNAECG